MRAGASPRIVVVEDDDAVREMVTGALGAGGYEVRAEAHGLAIEELVATFVPDLVVLDVRLAVGPSGLGLARLIRRTTDVPILFLTAADTLEDRLSGFDAGADDYLPKPFAVSELLARVRAILTRSGRVRSEVWQLSDLVVDVGGRRVTRAGTEITLTPTEFELLNVLGENRGRVMSKTQLLTAVWGFDEYDPNLVEVYIGTLRRKLDEHGPRLIQTVRGVGYVLRP